MTSPGELALQLQDQGWRGLLPLLPHDAAPNIRLAADKAAEVEPAAEAKPRDGGRGQGGRCCPTGARYPDDVETIEAWSSWPGVNVGLRACHAAPWVAFIDVDVLHPAAAGEMMELLRRRLDGSGEFIWRIGQRAQVPDPGAGHGAGHPVALDRGRDRRPAAHGRAAGRRASRPWSPASTRRRVAPTSGPLAGSRRRSRQAAAGDAGRARRDRRACSQDPAALWPGRRAQGPLASTPRAPPSPSRCTSCAPATRRSPRPPPSSSSTPTGAATIGWPGPTRCAAPSATPASRSGSGSRAVGQGHQPGHGREGLARRHPGGARRAPAGRRRHHHRRRQGGGMDPATIAGPAGLLRWWRAGSRLRRAPTCGSPSYLGRAGSRLHRQGRGATRRHRRRRGPRQDHRDAGGAGADGPGRDRPLLRPDPRAG